MAREAGIPNKNKRGLKAQLKQAYGEDFDVIMMMANNAKKLYDLIPDTPTIDDIDLISQTTAQLDKVAQYVEPKLKAIEISGNPENPLEVVTRELSPTERAARIAAILESGRVSRAGDAGNSGDESLVAITRSAEPSSD